MQAWMFMFSYQDLIIISYTLTHVIWVQILLEKHSATTLKIQAYRVLLLARCGVLRRVVTLSQQVHGASIAFNAIIKDERKVNADWLTVMSNLLRLSKAGLTYVEGPSPSARACRFSALAALYHSLGEGTSRRTK